MMLSRRSRSDQLTVHTLFSLSGFRSLGKEKSQNRELTCVTRVLSCVLELCRLHLEREEPGQCD